MLFILPAYGAVTFRAASELVHSQMPHQKNTVDWPGIAAGLRRRFEQRGLQPDVLAQLQRPSQQRRVLVACSGGADSVFMLCMLYSYAAELGLELVVGHYNHRWREADSDADAAFVQALAQGLSCRYVAGERPDQKAAFTETTARALRLDFLRESARKHECAWIAFGHQMDDILETQLQRLARGCSSDGLAAPRPVAQFPQLPMHVRPLLHLRAGDLRMTLKACGAPWREDGSNADVSIARNALRHEVIPNLIEALDRDPTSGAARSRRLLEEDAIALDAMARAQLPDAFSGAERLERKQLRAVPRALLRRALLAWLSAQELMQSVSAPAMDVLLEQVCGSKKKHRISAGTAYIMMDAEQLWVEPVGVDAAACLLEPTLVEPGDSVILSTGAFMEMQQVSLDSKTLDSILSGAINSEHEVYLDLKHSQYYEIRAWQPGDRFHPMGAPGTKKLKDWFIDRRIPQKERKWLPVVTTCSGEIVWVPGFPPAESRKLSRHTKAALRLTYQTRNSL